MEKQMNIFEVLIDAVCCVMCADRKVTTGERKAIHKILEKTKYPWNEEQINNCINDFIQRVNKIGLNNVIQETCDKLPEFKKRGKEHVLLQCIEYMVRADGVVDESEVKLCEKFRSALSIGQNERAQGQALSAPKNSPDHLLVLLDKELPCGKERYLQRVITEFFPKATINANVVVTKQINDKAYIVAMAIGMAKQAGFELDEGRVSWRNYATPDGVNATVVSIYKKGEGKIEIYVSDDAFGRAIKKAFGYLLKNYSERAFSQKDLPGITDEYLNYIRHMLIELGGRTPVGEDGRQISQQELGQGLILKELSRAELIDSKTQEQYALTEKSRKSVILISQETTGYRPPLESGADNKKSGSQTTEDQVQAPAHLRQKLVDAVQCGNAKQVANLLSAAPEITNLRDEFGYTLLHQAARDGQKNICETLLDKRVDINARTPEGWTALHLAATFAAKEVVQLLLSSGANINTRDNLGLTPLCQVAADGRKEIVEVLLAAGANVNIKDRAKQTPLRHATMKGHQEIVEILRKHGGK